jgi:hypothetical protein
VLGVARDRRAVSGDELGEVVGHDFAFGGHGFLWGFVRGRGAAR